MSDWSDGLDLGAIFGGDPSVNVPTDWTSGSDLPGGGDTGNPVGPPTSFNVGLGQIPSDVYQQLVQLGLIPQGATDVNLPPGLGGGGKVGVSAPSGGSPSGLGSFLSGLGPLGWAALLGPLLGGALGYAKTGTATNQVVGGINNASNAAQSILGGTSPFAPFAQTGQQALGKLNSFTWNPITMAPLGTRTTVPQPNATLASLLTSRKGR